MIDPTLHLELVDTFAFLGVASANVMFHGGVDG